MSDRKKDIYPSNVTICKDNCYYNEINREEEIIKCKWNLNASYTDNTVDDILNIVTDNYFISSFLDKINYKRFQCNKSLYDFDNLKSNFAFYIILCSLFVILIFNVIIIDVRFQDSSTSLIIKNNNYSNFTISNTEQKMKINIKSNIVNNKNKISSYNT